MFSSCDIFSVPNGDNKPYVESPQITRLNNKISEINTKLNRINTIQNLSFKDSNLIKECIKLINEVDSINTAESLGYYEIIEFHKSRL